MNKYHILKKATTFVAGMMVMATLTIMIGPALAAENQIAYGKIGVRLFGQQEIIAGEHYTAPNGQQVPSSITYTDAAGGKTNYLSIRQIAELLDADIAWSANTNSVDIAAPKTGNITVSTETADAESELPMLTRPEYGKVVGVFEEVDATTIEVLKDSTEVPAVYMKDTRVQYKYFGFPEVTANIGTEPGRYIVYTVTNNGKKDQYTTVSHKVTISDGGREQFPSVLVKPGETLVRAFRITKGADPLQSTLCFGIGGEIDRDISTDVTVSLEQYN